MRSMQPEIKSDLSGTDGETSSGGLDQKILALVVLVVIVGVALYLARRTNEAGANQMERARTGEDLEAAVEDDEDKKVIKIPVDPDDELEKDAAVLDALKESGKFGTTPGAS